MSRPERDARRTAAGERIEWIVGAISAALVAALLGYLAYQFAVSARSLPDLIITEAAEPGDLPGQIRFTVSNRGGRTASAVSVTLTLRDGGRAVAERRLVIDYVAADSEAAGGFLLPQGSEGLTPVLAVEGYLDP